jgi:hypothetical protein
MEMIVENRLVEGHAESDGETVQKSLVVRSM